MQFKPIAFAYLLALPINLLLGSTVLLLPAVANSQLAPISKDASSLTPVQQSQQNLNPLGSDVQSQEPFSVPNSPLSQVWLGQGHFLDDFQFCLNQVCVDGNPPVPGLQFSNSLVRNSGVVEVLNINPGFHPQLISGWFVSPSTPPAPGLRVVIRNVTPGMKGEVVPYSDRDYTTGSHSERFNATWANTHTIRYLAVLPGVNHFTYEIKRDEAVVESGTFTVAIALKDVPFTPPEFSDFSQPTYPDFSQPPFGHPQSVINDAQIRQYEQIRKTSEEDWIRLNPDIDLETLRSAIELRRSLDSIGSPHYGNPPILHQPLFHQQLQQDVELLHQLNPLLQPDQFTLPSQLTLPSGMNP